MESEKDIFILQILVSSLTLHNWGEIQMPIITVKLVDGPEVFLPYRSSGLHIPLEQNVQNSGIFTFEKGKSCLFTTKLGRQPAINLSVIVKNSVGGQQKAIGISELYQKQFDPHSLTVQSLLEGKVSVYNKENAVAGNVSMSITLQAIGSFRKGSKYRDVVNLPNTSHFINQYNPSPKKDAAKLTYAKSPVKKSRTLNDPFSSPNYSEAFCSSATESNSVTSPSDHESELFSKTSQGDNKAKLDKTTTMTINDKMVSRIISNEKPKGWLRSSPVYKGNILDAPPPIITTRSTFLNLSKKYPYLENHVQNEVKKQLKEKIKTLDNKYKEQMEIMKKKSWKFVPILRTSARASSRVQKQNKQTQSNLSPGGENITKISKETSVGNSLKDNFFDSRDDYDLLSDAGDDSCLSADSPKSTLGCHKNESSRNKYSEAFATSSTSETDKNCTRNKNSRDSVYLRKSSKCNTDDVTVKYRQENERKVSSEDEVEEMISRDPSRRSSDIYPEQHNLLDTRSAPNLSNGNQIQLPDGERLQHQGSKTTTSIYPETTEEEIKQKIHKQSPRGIDDVDDSISNISARIAALLIPRTITAPSVHTSSISSYEPSDFDEDLSSITKDEIFPNIHFSS